jgi:antitoxin (DNA-binding transcriptional repressor) of toxin-antitoxin stability system
MPKIEASKLNRSLKQVLEGVAEGKKFELTRYGKVVAKIVPPNAREPKPIAPNMTKVEQAKYGPAHEWKVEGKETSKAEPNVEQIRQKRREFLMRRIDRT